MGIEIIVAITIIVVVLFAALIGVLSRYRKCPSDKVLVIYGKVGNDTSGQMRSAKCIHGGAAFIIPIIQAYQYMDLTPISINVDLKNALSKQNIRVDVPSRFTVGISTEPGIMQNAAERLLGLKLAEIQELAKDIIFGQLRLVIATMDIEEINTDRDKFLLAVSNNVEIELKKIGLRLINVNVTDINDESGYIDALGKEAAAKAINDAKKSVAEKNRDGEIGHANALKDQRIQVAAADATAIQGENDAKIEVAQSDANRREKEAEALRQATAAEKVQAAMALQEAYGAQQRAEQERAALVRASQQADIVVKAEIDKQQRRRSPAARPEARRTPFMQGWRRRPEALRKFLPSRQPVCGSWSTRPAGIRMRRSSSSLPTSWSSWCSFRWTQSRISRSTRSPYGTAWEEKAVPPPRRIFSPVCSNPFRR